MDDGKAIFLYLVASKAFDTISRNISVSKLEHYSLNG